MGHVPLNIIAEEIKIKFKLLKNSFAASADSYIIPNHIEPPYCVVSSMGDEFIEQPTFTNPHSDFLIASRFRIQFFLPRETNKVAEGVNSPYWSYIDYHKSVTKPLVNLINNLFSQYECVVKGDSIVADTCDEGLSISYFYQQNICIRANEKTEFEIIGNINYEVVSGKD